MSALYGGCYTFNAKIKSSGSSVRDISATNWSSAWKSEILQNYISIQAVRATTAVETYEQDASISSVDLLSNVDSHTGLWFW
ncbi:unnamed protein product, partial [Rotaria socialis]